MKGACGILYRTHVIRPLVESMYKPHVLWSYQEDMDCSSDACLILGLLPENQSTWSF